MKWIDTHCHLYSEEFSGDIDELLNRAKKAGVEKFYLPAIDSNTLEAMLALEAKHPACIAMIGLHPCYVNAGYEQELAIVKEWLDKRKFTAVGEIGLDYYWSTEFATQQVAAFNQQMQWALDYNLPIVIHTRNAMQPTIDAVKPFADKGLRGIFHCFSGNAHEAHQIVNLGFYLGIGGILTYKKSGLPEAIQNISLEKIVLETDAPYLPPVPYRGKRNESSYIPIIAQNLAEVKNTSLEEVAAITTANAEKIFGS
ncbi:TatD family deoxyribonuclease [Ilyomonas limi]|uniref:TatD family deoxyribonuclease n=1 Tax=Ilyomonas limi TaxID=2575867 RepID=A0A4U3L7V9_9BACT|nr:TatD family hydrolase [Ilyomonas limi]TKK69767.1 TatD family deoxyribonuclease [Ilyomonas limi]